MSLTRRSGTPTRNAPAGDGVALIRKRFADLREAIERGRDHEVLLDLAGPLETAVGELVEEANQQREREREQLDALLEQLSAAVIVVSAPSGEIQLANRAAQELLRASGGAAARHTDLELRYPDGRPCPAADLPLVRALERGEETTAARYAVPVAGGSIRSVEVSAAPLRDGSGAVSGAFSTAVDVSVREQGERAEREFLSNAAHQLRNPLAAIRSAVEVLQGGAKESPDTRDRFLAHIERESERLTRLARALLLLARAQSMVEEPRKEIVQLFALLDDVAGRLKPTEDVSVEVRCSADLAVLSNGELLEEAVTCLADNAVRHARSGVILTGHVADGTLAVEVSDDGPGVPDEVKERVFDRFYRHGARPGFGLGLAIAAQAAEAIGASLEIQSQPGAGTVARMTLPSARLLEG